MPKKKRNLKKTVTTTVTPTLPTEEDFPSLGAIPASIPTSSSHLPQIGERSVSTAGHELSHQTVAPILSPMTDPTTSTSVDTTCEASKSSKPTQTKKEETPEELVKDLKKTLFVTPRPPVRVFPKRPDYLTEGKSLSLLTNHFVLKVGKKQAFHYDIEIELIPKTTPKDSNIVDKDVIESKVKDKRNKYSRKIATKLNRKIFEKMIEMYSQNANQVFYGLNPVYDGQKNMFTSKILTGTGGDHSLRLGPIEVDDNGRVSAFYVNIKMTETNHTIDLDVLNQYHRGVTCDDEVVKKSILFINTLLRHNLTMRLTPIGQTIFDQNNANTIGQEISHFVRLAYGHYSSVRNLMIGPTLNVDRSVACFYNSVSIENVIQYIIRGELSRVPKLTDAQRMKVKKELSGLQVEATHISYDGTSGKYFRKYRVLGISKTAANEYKFNWIDRDKNGKDEDHGMVTISQYFRLKYRIALKYPHLPCLEVGNIKNKVYLPLEVCKVVSYQRVRRSLTNDERSELTRIAGSQQPWDRLMQCQEYVRNQYHSGPIGLINRHFLYEFEIDVSKHLLEVDSKVIDPPVLKYNNNKTVKPQQGEWEMWKTGSTFYKPASITKWIIINMSFTESFGDNAIKEFVKDLRSQAKEMGLQMNEELKTVKISRFIPKTTFNGIKNNITDKRIFPTGSPHFILFITPIKRHEYSDDIYSEIKLLGDVEVGLVTQCVNIANLWNERDRRRKWNRSYLRQLMLKVNVKCGGTNVALVNTPSMPTIFKNKSLMIVGADVNHPAPADRITPSIAAVVGSYDTDFTNYYTTVSMQPKSREEMIKKLDQMIISLINNYRNKQKSLPQQIIFYRDGVSDGQFQHVIDNEYALLIKAFTHFGPKYKPSITFIVVQKRHHTRFMPLNTRRGERSQNIPPGTVVEKSITHKEDFDFYLCSHEGRIGTSRSAHYYVLADENGFNSNDMCKMTYYLCHIYQRCTKSVSIPAPVYYADLAAYRAKVHASTQTDTLSDITSVMSGSDERDDIEETKILNYEQLIRVNETQQQKLYYC